MKQKGFTLIELMIVIAIIGILASIALPAYQTYVIKARVTEGVSLSSAARLAVAEATVSSNALPANQAATGYVSPTRTANVDSIVIDDTGSVIVTYTASAGDGTLVYTPTLHPTGEVTWSCRGGSLPAQYRPESCR